MLVAGDLHHFPLSGDAPLSLSWGTPASPRRRSRASVDNAWGSILNQLNLREMATVKIASCLILSAPNFSYATILELHPASVWLPHMAGMATSYGSLKWQVRRPHMAGTTLMIPSYVAGSSLRVDAALSRLCSLRVFLQGEPDGEPDATADDDDDATSRDVIDDATEAAPPSTGPSFSKDSAFRFVDFLPSLRPHSPPYVLTPLPADSLPSLRTQPPHEPPLPAD